MISSYLSSIALGTGVLLWPFINHPFIFSFVFWGVFQDGWDKHSIQWFKDNVTLDIYSHVLADLENEVSDQIEGRLLK